VEERERRAWRREGRERRTVTEITVSILALGVTSESDTVGRKVWEIRGGREERTVVWASEGGALVGMKKVMRRLW